MLNVGIAGYDFEFWFGRTPAHIDRLVERARLHDQFGLEDDEARESAIVAVTAAEASWPHLLLSFRRQQIPGFPLGVFLVPETDVLLLGSDGYIFAYDLRTPCRLSTHETFGGFWCWRRFADVVLMIGELELAAYDLNGQRLWTTFVEPPWNYEVSGDCLDLDVMGTKSVLSLHRGPTG